MRITATIGILVLSLSAVPELAYAQTYGWWSTGSALVSMCVSSGASDGYDGLDVLARSKPWMAACYHGADEWGSNAGFYSWDWRSPLLPGATKTWALYVWGTPGSATGVCHLGWGGSNPGPLQGKLELVQKPSGIVGGPELGTVWTEPPGDITLPLYTTTDGLTGYGFTFTLTAVPEPSSLLALVTGAAGLAGFALRRSRGR